MAKLIESKVNGASGTLNTFLLGQIKFRAVGTWKMDTKRKLVEYDFAYTTGIDYVDHGEGERMITLDGYMIGFYNIGNNAVDDINSLERAIVNFRFNRTTRFIHPQLVPYAVRVDSFNFTKNGGEEGYKFSIVLKKITPVIELNQTQDSAEREFDARAKEGYELYAARQNDNLWKIAEEKLGDGLLWRRLLETNSSIIEDPFILPEGLEIRIPRLVS